MFRRLVVLAAVAAALSAGMCEKKAEQAASPAAAVTTAAPAATPTPAPPTATPTDTPKPVFDQAKFKSEFIDKVPNGLAMRVKAGPEQLAEMPGLKSMDMELAFTSAPVGAFLLKMDLKGEQEVSIEMRVVGEDAYLRGSGGGTDSGWLKAPKSEQTSEITSGMGPADFSPEEITKVEWTLLGEEACGDDNCFVMAEKGKENEQKLYVRTGDYRPIKIVTPSEAEGGGPPTTIDVVGWQDEVKIEAPSGEVREVTADEFGQTFLGLFLALAAGGTSGG